MNKKLKVAVQLFGHLRTYRRCYKSLQKKLLNRYDCDVFIHSWDRLEHNSQIWHQVDEDAKNHVVTQKDIEEIKKLYRAKKILVETQDFINFDGVIFNISLTGQKYMTYSMHMSNELRRQYENDNQTEYDFVIMIRPDIALNSTFSIKTYLDYMQFNKKSSIDFVHHATKYEVEQRCFYFPFQSDVFFLSSPSIMTEISNIYNHFSTFYCDFPKLYKNQIPYPEVFFNEYLISQGISPAYYMLDYEIVRANPEENKVLYPRGLIKRIKRKLKKKFLKFT
ncbi:MAG: hypothetical protein MK193_10240 [Lentisphaeria bacterium]|nr:hypothetical protein [Lentisphaeria bacterium]